MLGNADRVVVACVPERRLAWSTALKGIDVDVQMAYPELDAIGPLGLSRVGGKTTLKVGTGPLSRADQALKRMFDLAVVAIILPIVAPLMVLIALAVRLDSPGPIFFRQIRIGRCNRHFNMFKFRSMHDEDSDHDGNRSMRRGDDRVTRVGRFIRKTSIDELPQLLNVLFGTMSIVGPRPHAVGSTAADRLFWDIDQRYWHRHAIKPGLTGLAQVRGFRGATVIEADLTNRLQADLEYIAGWNIGRDVMIVMRTFRVLLHQNAY